MLWVAGSIERKMANELFTYVPPATFRKERILCSQFHAGCIAILLLSVLIEPHITGDNAFNDTIFYNGRLCCKTGKHLDT